MTYCESEDRVFTTFTKGVRWSPDGTCLLTADDSDELKLFEFPSAETTAWTPVLTSSEGETVYDYAWYPRMNSAEPASCCFVSSSRDHPLHLWDAFTGNLRASYRAFDHLDEIVAAFSVAFSLSGQYLLGGYNRAIRVFDVTEPGRPVATIATSATRKAREGQRGMISAMASSPADADLIAAGSYRGSVFLYDLRAGRAVSTVTGGGTVGGVTQLQFSGDGRFLFSGSRRGVSKEQSHVVCWDPRMANAVMAEYPRECSTHQRVGFDIDPTGRYLATGSGNVEDPCATVYDLGTGLVAATIPAPRGGPVNGVAFHPLGYDFVALSTGTRMVLAPVASGNDSEEEGAVAPPSAPPSKGKHEGKGAGLGGARKRARPPEAAVGGTGAGADGCSGQSPLGLFVMRHSLLRQAGELGASGASGADGVEGVEGAAPGATDAGTTDGVLARAVDVGVDGAEGPVEALGSSSSLAAVDTAARVDAAAGIAATGEAVHRDAVALSVTALSVASLRVELQRRGLSRTGRKVELAGRLTEAIAAEATAGEATEGERAAPELAEEASREALGEASGEEDTAMATTVTLPGGRQVSFSVRAADGIVRLGFSDGGDGGALEFTPEQWRVISQVVPLLARHAGK